MSDGCATGDLLPFDQAVAAVLARVVLPEPVELPLSALLGHVLARPAVALQPSPRFTNSAMDGYAVRAVDVAGAPVALDVQAVVQAGDSVDGLVLRPGSAIKILTGAPLPAGADAVVMREVCHERDGAVLVGEPARSGENIRAVGEEYRAGDEVLAAGARVTPPVIGLLAALGYAAFPVRPQPRVAVLTTGNELVAAGEPLAPGQIHDTNGPALAAAVQSLGLQPPLLRHAPDEPAAIRRALAHCLGAADVVLTIGGVSVGDYDYVKGILLELGVELHFWRVAVKPAKPTCFGTRAERLVFGLPGNPVSALLAWHHFVRPALLHRLGAADPAPRQLAAVLTQPLRHRPGRLEFVRGRLTDHDGDPMVIPCGGRGSHMLGGLAAADCLIRLPAHVAGLEAGERVTVELLEWT